MTPKNAAAVSLGRKGGKARAQNLTPEQRSESARKAVEARWAKADKLVADMKKSPKEFEQAQLQAERRRAKQKKAKP
jgi:hypothetical protein